MGRSSSAMRMKPFGFVAVHASGAVERGQIMAMDAVRADAELSRRGLMILRLKRRWTWGRVRAASNRDMATMLRLLSELLETGFPLGRALASLESLGPASLAPLLPHARELIRQGQQLPQALAGAGIVFPAGALSVIEAGVAGGSLASGLRSASEVIEAREAVRRSMISAMTYPALLACASATALVLLVFVALPRFSQMLIDLGRPIPPATAAINAVAGVVREWFLPGLAVFVAASAAAMRWARTTTGRAHLHRILLGIPGVGSIRLRLASARAARTLAALLDRGATMDLALRNAARACGDDEVSSRLLRARDRVLAGSPLSAAFLATNALSDTVIHHAAVGEETGRLSSLLTHAAEMEGRRADTLIRDAIRLIEPALIVIVGSAVALVLSAMLNAVYSIRPGS